MTDDQAEREKMVADAILFERAMSAMDRRCPREMMTEPVAHAVYHWLRGAAWQLRKDAGQELPPWSDPEYPHVRRDVAANFAREPERKVFE